MGERHVLRRKSKEWVRPAQPPQPTAEGCYHELREPPHRQNKTINLSLASGEKLCLGELKLSWHTAVKLNWLKFSIFRSCELPRRESQLPTVGRSVVPLPCEEMEWQREEVSRERGGGCNSLKTFWNVFTAVPRTPTEHFSSVSAPLKRRG